MQNRVARSNSAVWLLAASTAAVLAASAPASAADWPQVKVSDKSAVPVCATPGRMMGLVKARNAALDARFETIATDYMRLGEQLGMRWDYAFFQMLVETNNLTFKTGVRGGSVKPDQNNFAGLGAVGGSEVGESFPDVATGVRAHLEHVLIYAGQKVDNPIAERTRKVQDWGTLTSFHQGLKSPATFTDVVTKWAPKSQAYKDALDQAAEAFNKDYCKKADPHPEWVAAARGTKAAPANTVAKAEPKVEPKVEINPEPKIEVKVEAKVEPKPEKPSGAELAKKAVDDGKLENNNLRSGLGAGLARAKAQAQQTPEVKVLNAPAFDEPATQKTEPQKVAAAAGSAAKATAPQAPETTKSTQKCRVWTASYGGAKALIIKSTTDGLINYTVLDVNAGKEAVEAEAYIAAYAKGGKIEAEFGSQTQALDRAFDLCPEG